MGHSLIYLSDVQLINTLILGMREDREIPRPLTSWVSPLLPGQLGFSRSR